LSVAIICFDRNIDRAERVQSAIGGDVVVYQKNAFENAFRRHDAVVALMATGIILREVTPLLRDKWLDSPVVAVDDRLLYAIPMLGGHHGANAIARELFDRGVVRLPVISTATEVNDIESVEAVADTLNRKVINRESTKSVNVSLLQRPREIVHLSGPKIVIVDDDVSILSRKEGNRLAIGIGTRKGVDKAVVLKAIYAGLDELRASVQDVKIIGTAYLKSDERGIIDAALALEKPIAFVPKQVINDIGGQTRSRSEMLGLAGVAEPCALALSNLKELVLAKKVYEGVTLAVAR